MQGLYRTHAGDRHCSIASGQGKRADAGAHAPLEITQADSNNRCDSAPDLSAGGRNDLRLASRVHEPVNSNTPRAERDDDGHIRPRAKALQRPAPSRSGKPRSTMIKSGGLAIAHRFHRGRLWPPATISRRDETRIAEIAGSALFMIPRCRGLQLAEWPLGASLLRKSA
jgi:hypothetical protein